MGNVRIVLADDVIGLGEIGEEVEVRPGYARNFLIPRGLGFETGSKGGKSLTHHMIHIDAKKKRLKGTAADLAQKVRDIVVTLSLKTGEGGRVFGSISAKDIAEALAPHGIVIDRKKVILSEPIKKPGTHFVEVKLHAEVKAQLKVQIEGVEASQEEIETEVKKARETLS